MESTILMAVAGAGVLYYLIGRVQDKDEDIRDLEKIHGTVTISGRPNINVQKVQFLQEQTPKISIHKKSFSEKKSHIVNNVPFAHRVSEGMIGRNWNTVPPDSYVSSRLKI